MPPLQAELIDSALPVAETPFVPSHKDQAPDTNPETNDELVSDFRRDVIIFAALGRVIENASHHGPTTITAEHAAAVALQRIDIHTTLAFAGTFAREVPGREDISEVPSKLKVDYYFDPALTERERTKAHQKEAEAKRRQAEQDSVSTGAQKAVVDPRTDVIPPIEERTKLSLRERVASYVFKQLRLCTPFTPWQKAPDYYEQTLILREEQIEMLKEIEENGVPAYSHGEMKVISDALVDYKNADLIDEYGLFAFEERPVRSKADERELNEVIALVKNHGIDEVSFLALVDQRGLADAVLAKASGAAARVVRIMSESGDIITELPIDPALERY